MDPIFRDRECMSIVTSILAMNAPSFLELFDKQDRQTNRLNTQSSTTIVVAFWLVEYSISSLTPSCLDMGVTPRVMSTVLVGATHM